eukprot:674858-Pelagomonas_calceolata.AAC.1
MTREGSVASDAEKLAKPVLPDTEVALMSNAWGNNRRLMHALLRQSGGRTYTRGSLTSIGITTIPVETHLLSQHGGVTQAGKTV